MQHILRLSLLAAGTVFIGLLVFALVVSITLPALFSSLPVEAAMTRRLIDGQWVRWGAAAPRLVGVIIDGVRESRPLEGLARAALVWEAPVEGGIPRFFALYPSDAVPETVGPVRSLRPYFLDFAAEVDALLLHVGGSPEALVKARTAPVDRLNQFYDHVYFWRSRQRQAPYNVFTGRYLITRALADRNDRRLSRFSPWRYTEAQGEERGETGIRIPFSTPSYTVEWRYDPAQHVYRRFVGGEEARDADGTPVTAANVLVQFVSGEILDAIGRRRITTEGEGRALVLTAGDAREAKWKKDVSGRTRFYDILTGEEMALQAGTTWIEILSKNIEPTFISNTKEPL